MSIPMERSIHYLSAHELQAKLESGELTSADLTASLLDTRIDIVNKCNAVVSHAPRDSIIKLAKDLDAERAAGKVRSKLHGIPIVVKDVVINDASMGMGTSAGASGVMDTMAATKNSVLLQRLLDAGMIVVAKTNLTELCGLKSNNTPIGWSGVQGQTLSPYRREGLDEKDQPEASGSSSGSCVCVAAGFTPMAVGSDTSGSIIFPGMANGVYAVKLYTDSVPEDGLFRMTDSFDAMGPIARDVDDLIALADVMTGTQTVNKNADIIPENPFEGWRIGATSPEWGVHESMLKGKWDQPDVLAIYNESLDKIEANGAKVTRSLSLAEAETFKYNGEGMFSISYQEFPLQFEKFASYFSKRTEIHNLNDLIKWNEANASRAMPDPYSTQTELINSSKTTLDPKKRDDALAELRRMAVDAISETMTAAGGLDILLTSETTIIRHLALADWAHAAIPTGQWKKNGQPLGMIAVPKDGRLDTLLRFMRRWQRVFPDVVQRPE